MTFGSLFSGIGGLDLGLERAGMECRWQVEIEPSCQDVLRAIWPKVPKYGDIKQVEGKALEAVDLICGGFPCQDLSMAGKRAGIEGSRSGLWFEFARLVGELRPRYLLIENVPGLLAAHRDGERVSPAGISRVVGELARLGYVGCWRCLRASEFGTSHLRKRVFIVARKMAHGASSRCDGSTGEEQRVLGPSLPTARSGDGNGYVAHTGHAGEWRSTQSAGEYRRGASSDDRGAGRALADSGSGQFQEPGRGPQGRDGAGSTSAVLPAFAPGPSDPRWPDIIRHYPWLAPALKAPSKPPLCGMADGLPDWVDRAMRNRTKRLKALGNAVVPQVAEWIGRRIMENAR